MTSLWTRGLLSIGLFTSIDVGFSDWRCDIPGEIQVGKQMEARKILYNPLGLENVCVAVDGSWDLAKNSTKALHTNLSSSLGYGFGNWVRGIQQSLGLSVAR